MAVLIPWYKKFVAARKRADYAHSLTGAASPTSHFKRPSRLQIMAMAQRFMRDGEQKNCTEMLKLAYPENKQLTFTFRPYRPFHERHKDYNF